MKLLKNRSKFRLTIKNYIFEKDFLLSLIFFCTLILLISFNNEGITRYILNLTLLTTSLFIYFNSPIRNKLAVWFCGSLVYLIFIFASHLFIEKPINFTLYVSFYSFYLVAYFLIFSKKSSNYVIYFYKFYFIATVSIFIILLNGTNPNDVFAGSRNSISLFLVPLGSLFILDNRVNLKSKYSISLYLIVFLCCVLALGRSGILTSLILITGLLLNYTKRLSYKKAIYSLLFVIIFLFFLQLYIDNIYNLDYFDYLRTKGLEDSSRSDMKAEYLSSLSSGSDIIFGINLSTLPIISSFNSNPHNTYIAIHSYLGIIAIITIMSTIIYWIKSLLSMNLIAVFALTALMLRLTTDSTFSTSLFPLIFASLLIFSKTTTTQSLKI